MYADYEIREVPIGYGPARRKVEEFLGKRTLRLDKVDYYEAIYPCGGDEMLAVGGLLGDAIRCIAVKEGFNVFIQFGNGDDGAFRFRHTRPPFMRSCFR